MVQIEAKIAHSRNKVNNAASLVDRVEKDQLRQTDSVAELEEADKDIKEKIQEAISNQRKTSQAKGRILSAADLEEYRRL